ncbi:MAG: hypothetical protein C0497_06075 [Gemmatimonas sp.]|nr:hypothetical protein [Gemmatimonas sp.]
MGPVSSDSLEEAHERRMGCVDDDERQPAAPSGVSDEERTALRHVGSVCSGSHRIDWWASRAPGLSIGDVIDARATVKKHEEYKGVKQTVVTRLDVLPGRPKAVDVLAAAAAADQAVAADTPGPTFVPGDEWYQRGR